MTTEAPTWFVIWSGEHNAYWRPRGHGYTRPGRREGAWTAGLFTCEEAERWTCGCGPEKQIEIRPLSEVQASPIEPNTVLGVLVSACDSALVAALREIANREHAGTCSCVLSNGDHVCDCHVVIASAALYLHGPDKTRSQ
jgi:hypothetical protein